MTTHDARALEHTLSEPWGAVAASAALDEDLVKSLVTRFAIMTASARRGAVYAGASTRRAVPFARTLADAGADDSDEWVRAISCAVRGAAEGDNRFDLDGLRASVPAVRA